MLCCAWPILDQFLAWLACYHILAILEWIHIHSCWYTTYLSMEGTCYEWKSRSVDSGGPNGHGLIIFLRFKSKSCEIIHLRPPVSKFYQKPCNKGNSHSRTKAHLWYKEQRLHCVILLQWIWASDIHFGHGAADLWVPKVCPDWPGSLNFSELFYIEIFLTNPRSVIDTDSKSILWIFQFWYKKSRGGKYHSEANIHQICTNGTNYLKRIVIDIEVFLNHTMAKYD